jgi:hypothetical protein
MEKTKLIDLIKSQNLTLKNVLQHQDVDSDISPNHHSSSFITTQPYEQSPYFVNSQYSQMDNVTNKQWVSGLRNTRSRSRSVNRAKRKNSSSRRANRSYLDYSANLDQMKLDKGELEDRKNSLDLMRRQLSKS